MHSDIQASTNLRPTLPTAVKMDKTKSKLAAFFDNDDEDHAFPQKPVDDHKLSHYTQGNLRKSKREKEKEAAEAKRREEEASAARAYAEFVDAFDAEGSGQKKASSTFVKSGQGNTYAPSTRGAGPSRPSQMFEDTTPPSPPQSAPKPKGRRAMDSFLEEIKREQATRESKFARHVGHGRSVTSMAAYEGQSGSKDRGDPETSNVFVANLPPHVTEQSLGQFFARCGPVASVKIMWPRGDATTGPGADMTQSRRSKSSGLSGFVAFMKRKGAEEALRELDGFDWGGSVLRVGWSKAVPIAAKPMYVSAKAKSKSRSRSRSASLGRHRERSRDRDNLRSRSRSRDQPRFSRRRSRSRSPYSRSPSRSRSPRYRGPKRYDSRRRSPSRSRSRSHDKMDADDISDAFIRTVAVEVRGHGIEYEEKLHEREKANPKYAFMLKDHRRYRYYCSVVGQQDSVDPEFDDDDYNSVYSTDSAEESERERGRKNELGRLARKRFEAMLRALSGRRGELARCMAFSLEHAEAANEIADIIISSLLVDGTPVPRKVARLHLICDILHNSAAPLPMAWKFRQEFQSRLGLVFDHLSTIYHSFPGRITAETFKKQITSVVDIWEDWIVFPIEFTRELRERLEGNTAGTAEEEEKKEETDEPQDNTTSFAFKFKASSFKPAAEEPEPEPTAPPGLEVDDTDGEPMDEESDVGGNVDGDPMVQDDDVDGVAIDDVDGEAIDDVDGEPLDDVDGVPMADVDVDGEPMAEADVDGEPMAEADVDGEPMDDDVDGAPLEE
ncbi:hypothetical protein EIP91_011746 [Steccherinum ochraceum]|uniref:U2 snRNP-associated SURP domain-containing protein n=1 Tax=Steccherinum ochraceum TaxID=92696 RepID=A0A4V2MXS4_9APHY|nr:hypothetical protein EIP91_011746 [Steccherinum ochraceum]